MNQPEVQPIGLSGARDRLRDAKNARAKYEPEMYMNLSFFQGDQWCAWNGQSLYTPRVTSRYVITDNRIRPAVRREVAKLSKSRPGWATLPRQLDDQAVEDALTAGRLLEWAWDKLGLAPKRREALLWSRICGAGFIKTVWDPDREAGVQAVVDPDGKPMNHPSEDRPLYAGEMPSVEALPGVTTRQVGGGDVTHIVRSPFSIYPDPLATSLDDARWLIDEQVRSPEYVFDRYGKKVAPDAAPQVGIVESRYHQHALTSAESGKKLGVKVYELWEKPSKSNPEGRRVCWTENELLYEGPNEYKRIPYTMFSGVVVPGRFWPDAMVSDMRPLQVRLNKLESQIAENVSRFGNPALLLDALSDVKVFGVPGEQIRHNATLPSQLPQYLAPPPMQPYVFNLLDQVQNSMKEISGQFEVSQGSVPSGVTAAGAISMLTEQADTLLGPDVEDGELAIADVGQQTLDLMARFYTTDRVVVITGEDGIVDQDVFRSHAEFKVPIVQVVAQSTFPRSLAARQAAIRDTLNLFLQYGVPIDQAALPQVLRNMQVGGLDQLVASSSADVQQVTRENAEFLRGGPLAVRQTDNDAIHIKSHADFTKSQRFANLDPQVQAAYMDHILQHEMQQKMKQMAQIPAYGVVPPPPPVDPNAMPPAPGAAGPDQPPQAQQLPPSTLPTQPSGNPAGQGPPVG